MISTLRRSALALPIVLAIFTIHVAVNTFCHLPADSESGSLAGWNPVLLCLNSADGDANNPEHHDSHSWCGCIINTGGQLLPPSTPTALLLQNFEREPYPDHADTRHPVGRHPHFSLSRGPPSLAA